MYQFVLAIHNIVRWLVVIFGIVVVVRAFTGWRSDRDWQDADRKWGVIYTSTIDTQLLLGLILYIFLSPIVRTAFQNFGAAMGVPDLRFFALEHIFYMLVAIVFAHLGTALPKKVEDSKAKHKRALILLGISLLIVLIGMPWGRPLFPGLG